MNKDIKYSNIIIEDKDNAIDLFDVLFSYLEYKKTILLSLFLSIFLASLHITISKPIKEYALEFTQSNNLQFVLSIQTINKINELGFDQENIKNQFIYNLSNIKYIDKSANNMLEENSFTMDKTLLVNNYLRNIQVKDNKIVLYSREKNEEVIQNIIKAHTKYNLLLVTLDLLESLKLHQKSLEISAQTLRKNYNLNHTNKSVRLENEIQNYKVEFKLMNSIKSKKINDALEVAKQLGITEPMFSRSKQVDLIDLRLNFTDVDSDGNKDIFNENMPPYYLGSILLEKIFKDINSGLDSNIISTTRWASLQTKIEKHNNSKSDEYIEGLAIIQNNSEEISNTYSEIESIINVNDQSPFIFYNPDMLSIYTKETSKLTILCISVISGFIFSFVIFILHTQLAIRKNKVAAQDY